MLLGGKDMCCVLGTVLWRRAALLDGRKWDCWMGGNGTAGREKWTSSGTAGR